jgi:putative FmdB family regulatory protein
MPTYSYECQACGTKFDQYQKFDDAPITKCPNCKKNKVRRVFMPAAIVFKGSGWYKTDSRSKSPTTPKSTEKSADKPASESATAEKSADTSASNGSNGDGDGKAAKPKKEKAPAKSSDD